MAPSQLKRLKASLREQGVVGPQKSKKQKQAASKNVDQRLQRQAALQSIRDSFNPFEIKAPARTAKFGSMSDRNEKLAKARPGVTKSEGEKVRRKNLLPELQRRNKVGEFVDRRLGEDDATMTPEERALQRFIRERGKRKNAGIFDLEGDEEETGLTHLGKALDLGDMGSEDDFKEDVEGSDSDAEESGLLKRKRSMTGDNDGDGAAVDDGEDEPVRKKSKQEVMKEVIAKSKLHKYERQKAKEDDDDLRARLDSEMGDLLALLHGRKPEVQKSNGSAVAETSMNAERLAMLQGKSREEADKEYDARLRQLALDQRAAPTDRSKTEEEKARDEAERLKNLEESRQKRMRGEISDDSSDEKDRSTREGRERDDDDEEEDEAAKNGFEIIDEKNDAAEFGLEAPARRTKMPVLDDEDEFELDDDLIASGSDLESGSEIEDNQGEDPETNGHEDEEDEFVKGILDEGPPTTKINGASATSVAYTYPCPQSHEELLGILRDVPSTDVALVIQRIRALYHPSLSKDNKSKLANFAQALVQHLPYLGANRGSLSVVENITRHLHSLSRTFPLEIAEAFRSQLSSMHEAGDIARGDLVTLLAIGSIYPTSDHFHQVVTPAVTIIARWLSFTSPKKDEHLEIGAFLVSLVLHYQRISKRYMPEALRFTVQALQSVPMTSKDLIEPHRTNLLTMADQLHHLSAFIEIFSPAAVSALKRVNDAKAVQRLQILLSQAKHARRPLELHHHRPQPIRTSVPKFEDNYAPGKHYDPDKDRSDAAKLRKEYKRERKGALRELRKDANFIAREQLREKKERDAAYEKKFRRLVAEINSEEGRQANEYDREKTKRQKAKKSR